MGVREDFATFCQQLREETNTKMISVEEAGKGMDPAFTVKDSTVPKYEQGTLPTFPKLLTLARAYEVPVAVFYEAIGAESKELCDCHSKIPGKGIESRYVAKLLRIIRKGGKRADALTGLLDELIPDE